MTLADFFTNEAPTIWFGDGSSLTGNSHVQLKATPDPFPAKWIDCWDWAGVDIRKESQGIAKSANSIQYRVIQELKKTSYSLIFDDDGNGETADVVAILEEDDAIVIELYHCKFSGEAKPGKRIGDLYELCGQSQKCVRWMDRPTKLLTRLLTRDPKRRKGKEASRYEVGTRDDLLRIREKSRRLHVYFRVFLVQPGLSKSNADTQQLILLGVAENYLKETFVVPIRVICSK